MSGKCIPGTSSLYGKPQAVVISFCKAYPGLPFAFPLISSIQAIPITCMYVLQPKDIIWLDVRCHSEHCRVLIFISQGCSPSQCCSPCRQHLCATLVPAIITSISSISHRSPPSARCVLRSSEHHSAA